MDRGISFGNREEGRGSALSYSRRHHGILSNIGVQYRSTSHPRPTQPSIPPGSVNEHQLHLGRRRQVWFTALADERRVRR